MKQKDIEIIKTCLKPILAFGNDKAKRDIKEALLALEKQVPRRPKNIDEDYSYFDCPRCDFVVGYADDKETHKYCLNCGQKLDWC